MSSGLCTDISILQKDIIIGLESVKELLDQAIQRLYTKDGNQEQHFAQQLENIKGEIEKVKKLELKMAIAAPMKAGKSTIINALIGQELLPTRNTAMTTLPTEIAFSRNVSEPILKIPDHEIFKQAWEHVYDRIQEEGIEKAKEELRDYPHLYPLLEEINTNNLAIAKDTIRGQVEISKELSKLNDLCRIAGTLTPLNPLINLQSIPRLEVPFFRSLDPTCTDSLANVGSLVIVDTPGPNETGKLKLEQVLRQQLESCSLVLLVLDYTQLNSEAAEKVKNDVGSFVEMKGVDALYILVNKVDMRRSDYDMSPEEVIEFVQNKFNIKQDSDRVFEVSATRAAYVSNFMAELEQIEARGDVPEISKLNTLKPLAMQAYGDFWQRRIKTMSIDQIKEDSQIIWEESGFDSFLNKSVLALLRKILPSIVISALNLALSVLKDLQNRIKSRRNSLSSDVNKVQEEIDHLVNDIKKLEESNQNLRQDIGSKTTKLNERIKELADESKRKVQEEIKKLFEQREWDEANIIEKFGKAIIVPISFVIKTLKRKEYLKTGKLQFDTKIDSENFISSLHKVVIDLVENQKITLVAEVNHKFDKLKKIIKSEFDANNSPIRAVLNRMNKALNLDLTFPEINAEYYNFNAPVCDAVEYKINYTINERFILFGLIPMWWYIPVTKQKTVWEVRASDLVEKYGECVGRYFQDYSAIVVNFIEQDIQTALDRYVFEIENFLKGVKNELEQSIKIRSQDVQAQAQLQKECDLLLNQIDSLYRELETRRSSVKNAKFN